MKRLFLGCIAVFLILSACSKPVAPESTDADVKETSSYYRISQEEARAMMNRKDGHIVVDVRRQYEYEEGHIPGAVCIPNEVIDFKAPTQLPDKTQIILLYCMNGIRSKEAAQKLVDLGYTQIYEFGGVKFWPGELVKGAETGVYRDDDTIPDYCVQIGTKEFSVLLEENDVSKQFATLVFKDPFGVLMDDRDGKEKRAVLQHEFYGTFNNSSAFPGDILLYPDNSIAVCYEEMSGSFVKIGHILGIETKELRSLLGEGEIMICFIPVNAS